LWDIQEGQTSEQDIQMKYAQKRTQPVLKEKIKRGFYIYDNDIRIFGVMMRPGQPL
jgi:hypothetical protein